MMRGSRVEEAHEAFDTIFPHVRENPYCVHAPHPKQLALLSSHLKTQEEDPEEIHEVLYGGAAGGGKSDALLMAAAQYVHVPNYAAVIIRRTYKQLSKPNAIMDRALQWWLKKGNGVHWSAERYVFTFPSGARIQFGYHNHPSHDDEYHGPEYQFVGFDEMTQWPDDHAYMWLRSRVRRLEGVDIPLRMVSTSNPGGPGHTWVKHRFVGGRDLASGKVTTALFMYIPAKIGDNPSLDRSAYVKTLDRLHPTRRAQLLDGNWDARDPGDYYRVEWFGPMLDPVEDHIKPGDAIRVRWWDLAASEKETAARTAGVKMARLRSGCKTIEHATAFRMTPGKRDARIIQQAELDGRHVYVGIEIEGGSGGPAQFEALERQLKRRGFRVVGARPKAELSEAESKLLIRQPVHEKGKLGRAVPVASRLERGHSRRGECDDTGEPWWGEDIGRDLQQQRDGLRIYAGVWTQEYLDEVEAVGEEGVLMDYSDATSAADAFLEAHPFGLQIPPGEDRKSEPVVLHDVHPDDRPEPAGVGRDRAGHWRP